MAFMSCNIVRDKHWVKQTYVDFERIADLDPSNVVDKEKKNAQGYNYVFATEKQTNEVDNATFRHCHVKNYKIVKSDVQKWLAEITWWNKMSW